MCCSVLQGDAVCCSVMQCDAVCCSESIHEERMSYAHPASLLPFRDGYCSTVQGFLDWFEVDLGFTELLFIQIDLCVMCVFMHTLCLCLLSGLCVCGGERTRLIE